MEVKSIAKVLLILIVLSSNFARVAAEHERRGNESPWFRGNNAMPAQFAHSNPSASQADEAAGQVLEKYIEALGGRSKFASIKTIETQLESLILGRTIKIYQVDDIENRRSYRKQEGGNGLTELGFDGARAWQRAAFFRGYLQPTSQQARALTRVRISLFGAALHDYREGGTKFSRLPDEKVSGKDLIVISGTRVDESNQTIRVKYYFDPVTFLLRQIVSGSAITQTEVFDDYRTVEGRTIAFTSSITNPQITMVNKVISVKVNTPVDPKIFQFGADDQSSSGVSTPAAAPIARDDTNTTDKSSASGLSEKLRLETFEYVWQTINDTYWDKTFNGIDWKGIHAKYLPLVKATAESDAYHRLLNSMVQELHLSHFRVIPPGRVITLKTDPADLENGTVGLSVKWINNEMLVADVKAGSSASEAGIKKGFIITTINEKTLDRIYDEYKKENTGYQLREELARVRAAGAELEGKPGTSVQIQVRNESGRPLSIGLERRAGPLVRQLEFESKQITKDIGYIKFNLFFGDLLEKFQTAIKDLRGTSGLVIDLRGNPGGAGDLAPAIANILSAKSGSLGRLRFRYETREYSFAGTGDQAYGGRVILLVDEGSGSTAEVFAGGLQTSRRATVVGARTAGAVLPSLAVTLPSGAALQHVISDFETPNRTILEGRGVIPDVPVAVSRAGLLKGRDEPLDRALEILRKRN